MKVKMLAATYWGGNRLAIGDVVEVASTVAERWIKTGIAEKQTVKSPKKMNTDKE